MGIPLTGSSALANSPNQESIAAAIASPSESPTPTPTSSNAPTLVASPTEPSTPVASASATIPGPAATPSSNAECAARTLLPGMPAGFQPLTASASELRQYGLPPKPKVSADQLSSTGWGIAMAALTAEDPAGASCEQGTVPFTTIYSGNYAGYRVHDSTVGATEFDSTDSTWTVPDVEDHIHTGCSAGDSTPSVAAWVGIGATDIIQSGTVSCSTDPASYRFWNEDYSAPPVYEGPSVSAYDEVYAILTNG